MPPFMRRTYSASLAAASPVMTAFASGHDDFGVRDVGLGESTRSTLKRDASLCVSR